MEESEFLKQFTDCVYFLASPLTCIKGIECEYRHSEIARLNPKDCWYWLAGSCLNHSCAFRHPPLDIHTELLSGHAPFQDQSSTSREKVEVPCYFYFSGFCKKGDRCSFLHGSNDAPNVSKTAPAISDAPQLENKTANGCNMVSAGTKTFPILSETALKPSGGPQVEPKEDVSPSESKSLSASPHTSSFEIEEAPAARLDTVIDREGSIQSESESYTDQSSEEQVGVPSRENYCLESPPGFDVLVDDVLVDDRSCYLAYEDDTEYPVDIERDGRELNNHYFGHDYADYAEYAGTFPEERKMDSCVDFEDETDDQQLSILRRSSRYDDEKMNPGSFWEEELLPVSLSIDGHRGDDLRLYPRNDRVSRLPRFSERSGDRAVDLRSYPRNDRVFDDPRLPRFSERSGNGGFDLRSYPRNDRVPRLPRFSERSGVRGVDPRSYPINDRVANDPRLPGFLVKSCFSEQNNFPPKVHGNHEKSRHYGRQRHNVGKLGVNKRRFKDTNCSGQFMKSHLNISRQHHKETRQPKKHSPNSSRKPVTGKRVTEGYSEFSGPKTLDQIKAEKRRSTRNGDSCGNLRHFSKKAEEFQGPKPLSEILKDKRKLQSVGNV